MPGINRKSAPKVKNGTVQKKNDWSLSESYYYAPLPRTVIIDRKRPGVGFKHILNKSDIYTFLELLPDWKTLAVALNAIVLCPGYEQYDGYHTPGVVHVCAWEEELWREHTKEHHEAHKDILERFGVESEETSDGVLCKFDEPSIRAYQLLHILLHELGHHHDRMTTRKQKRSGRGEAYAEEYARIHEAAIWRGYQSAFRF